MALKVGVDKVSPRQLSFLERAKDPGTLPEMRVLFLGRVLDDPEIASGEEPIREYVPDAIPAIPQISRQ
jgi:hypothetical protein